MAIIKVFSKLLETEVELPVYKVEQEDGETKILPKFKELQEALYSCGRNPQVTFNEYSANGYPAMECIIMDATGRYVTAYGSGANNSLETEIAKSDPLRIARKRAFMAAILFYLQLDLDVEYDEEEEPAKAPAVSTEEIEALGNEVVAFGAQKGKTVANLFETEDGKKWATYIASSAKNGPAVALANIIKRYCLLKKITLEGN